MVEVIHRPKQERTTCRSCGATLGYTFLDIQERTYKDISQCTETEHYILCPCCNTEVRVSKYSRNGYYNANE